MRFKYRLIIYAIADTKTTVVNDWHKFCPTFWDSVYTLSLDKNAVCCNNEKLNIQVKISKNQYHFLFLSEKYIFIKIQKSDYACRSVGRVT